MPKQLTADEMKWVDGITRGAGPWTVPDNEAVFRGAVLVAMQHGLSGPVAEATFLNAELAARRDGAASALLGHVQPPAGAAKDTPR